MPAILHHALARRSVSTGKTFSIVFVVVAFLVVAACILWGYFIPNWRSIYSRPSSTRFKCLGGAAKYLSPHPPPRYVQHFPSHPALRGMHKKASRSLLLYDPRTETPFPNNPQMGDCISLSTLNLTPCPQSKRSWRHRQATHIYELPKTPGTLSQLAGTLESLQTSDEERAADFDIPEVPHPVARPAGRPPHLIKQLERFPLPATQSSQRFDTSVHPNLLFAKLDKLDKLDTDMKPQPSAQPDIGSTSEHILLEAKRFGDSRKNTLYQNSGPVSSEPGEISDADSHGHRSAGQERAQSLGERTEEKRELKSEASQELKQSPAFAEKRNSSGLQGSRIKFTPLRHASFRQYLTPSTELLTASTSAESECVQPTTPPTSPLLPQSGILDLLPTPLRLRHAVLRASTESPTHRRENRHLGSSKANALTESPEASAPLGLHTRLKSKRNLRLSLGFYNRSSALKKTRGQLNASRADGEFDGNSRKSPGFDGKERGDENSSGVELSGPKLSPPNSCQGSSVYSRNTRGISYLRTPTFAAGDETQTQGGIQIESPNPAGANSMELFRNKIERWNLDTGNLDLSLPAFPVSTRKWGSLSMPRPSSEGSPTSRGPHHETKSLAPLIPRDPKEQLGKLDITSKQPCAKICLARPGDGIFRDGENTQLQGRVLKKVRDMEMTNSASFRRVSTYMGQRAPGDAGWV